MKNHTFKRIYTGDYTDIGHQQGVSDGKKGTSKTHWGVLTKRHWLNFLWQSDTAHDSYVSGYNKGYKGGQRVKENIYQDTSITSTQPNQFSGTNMAKLQRFERVLQGLETAKNNIKLNIQQLQTCLAQYSRQIEGMEQAGYMEDYTKKLKTYNGLKVRIEGLERFLQQLIKKLAEIEEEIRELKAQAERDN